MMIRHHPDDEILLSLAAGRLPAGATLIVSVHLEYCLECRQKVRLLQEVGGAFMEGEKPHPLRPGALASTLGRIDDAPRSHVPAAVRSGDPEGAPSLLKDVPALESLRRCKLSPWYWIGFGRRLSRVHLPHESSSSLFLLCIAPTRSLPRHSHTGLEFTQVLRGSFHNGQSVLGPGDFDTANREARHQPVAEPGGVCVCLVWLEAPLRFDWLLFSRSVA